jgi:hypothetical protein
MITHVKFVSVPTTDQDRALAFWTGRVGFRVLTDQPFDGSQRWIELRIGSSDTRLVLPEYYARAAVLRTKRRKAASTQRSYSRTAARNPAVTAPTLAITSSPWTTMTTSHQTTNGVTACLFDSGNRRPRSGQPRDLPWKPRAGVIPLRAKYLRRAGRDRYAPCGSSGVRGGVRCRPSPFESRSRFDDQPHLGTRAGHSSPHTRARVHRNGRCDRGHRHRDCRLGLRARGRGAAASAALPRFRASRVGQARRAGTRAHGHARSDLTGDLRALQGPQPCVRRNLHLLGDVVHVHRWPDARTNPGCGGLARAV